MACAAWHQPIETPDGAAVPQWNVESATDFMDESGISTGILSVSTPGVHTGAGIPAIETVYPEFKDLAGLLKFARQARHDGFVGMMAIHPTQVPVINEAFIPTEAEIRPRRIIELFETHPDAGALALEGEMLDAPHLLQARTILHRAEGRPVEATDGIARG